MILIDLDLFMKKFPRVDTTQVVNLTDMILMKISNIDMSISNLDTMIEEVQLKKLSNLTLIMNQRDMATRSKEAMIMSQRDMPPKRNEAMIMSQRDMSPRRNEAMILNLNMNLRATRTRREEAMKIGLPRMTTEELPLIT